MWWLANHPPMPKSVEYLLYSESIEIICYELPTFARDRSWSYFPYVSFVHEADLAYLDFVPGQWYNQNQEVDKGISAFPPNQHLQNERREGVRRTTTSDIHHHRRLPPTTHPPLLATTTSRKNLLGPTTTPPPAPLPTTKVMFPMSLDSVPSTMPQRSLNQDEIDTNEKEKVWSGYNGDGEEVSSGSSKKECDEICTNEDGKEETENIEDRVEQPKEGMIFDTLNDTYLYYSRYAKENGFAVAKRTNKKGRDRNLRNVTFQCCRGGKAKHYNKYDFL
ncbi:uncharacterized protein LOC131327594 [Rhododendron vialii]|uniref:uncharacterized protein LOC131327594 n=1 Tax=Rhododendron vialii TaxID=182163 RepID=UPI00265E2A5F|nr:uncharacterized protein LOC131327594 [Rhododendron vialii]